ncbi:putative metal-binding motif-containing protein [Candidatus Uhrbacteria bacterium]|nr:putative metal-binding motif-containing protein [Candidatus Uhrbacteria bacterium]
MCNGKDDNCDGVTDEGCATPPNPPATTDSDKDGYPDGPQDCAPYNANIYPGAVELCDKVDNDCDGVVDEACPATPPVTSGTTATFTVSYPDNAPRTLNVQVYDDKSDLGGWWDKSASSTTTSVGLSLDAVPDGICGFRVNVSEGNPATSWLCAGNGSTASLDQDAGITVVYKGITYTKGSFMTWSAPGGTASGCSALLKISTAANCSP